MATKSDTVSNEKECNKNMSSQDSHEKFQNSDNIQKKSPSSPENSTGISDAFLADLLSKEAEPNHSSNETCNSQPFKSEENLNNFSHPSKDINTLHSELKDIRASSDGPSFVESVEKIDCGTNDQGGNVQDISTNSKDSPDLVGSSLVTHVKEIPTELSVTLESNEIGNINLEKKEENPSSEPLTEEAVKMHNEVNKSSYREPDSWKEDDSSSSSVCSSSSSDCSDSFLHEMQREVHTSQSNKVSTLKTKGELDIDELPPIEDLQISVNESDLEKIGIVVSTVKTLVIVRALKSLKPLDSDSVLFITPQKPLGHIFEVFGPVSEPFYVIRFNSVEHIIDSGVEIGCEVFYAPQKKEITNYVFVDELRMQKGSDASWKDNNEPPEEFIDYSDDEQEKVAKQKRRAKTRPKPFEEESKSCKKDQPEVQFCPPQPSVSPQQNLRRNHQPPKVQYHRSQPFIPRPQQNPSHNYRSPEVPFRPAQTFVSQAQQNLPPTIPPPRPQFHPPQPFVPQPQQTVPPTSFRYQSPPQSTYQFHQPPPVSQPARYPSFYVQHQVNQPKAVEFHQPHVFGQITPIGPVSPALQQPPVVHFPPSVMSPPPLVSIPPASPNFSFFSHKYVSAPSPPAHGHVFSNSSWVHGQTANVPPRVGYPTSLSPLSIQIPNNLRTPPPTFPSSAANSFNGVSPIQLPQNIGPYMHQPGTRPY